MQLSLPPDLEDFVNSQVAAGRYETRGELIREALVFLRERDRIRELRLQDLRKEIQVGLDQLERGERSPLNMEDIKKEVLAQIAEHRGR